MGHAGSLAEAGFSQAGKVTVPRNLNADTRVPVSPPTYLHPLDEENVEEHKVAQEESGDGKEEEEEEAKVAKVASEPNQPTKDEISKHCATHLPYRSWCPHCVAGKKPDAQHHQLEGEHMLSLIHI